MKKQHSVEDKNTFLKGGWGSPAGLTSGPVPPWSVLGAADTKGSKLSYPRAKMPPWLPWEAKVRKWQRTEGKEEQGAAF